MSAARAFLHRLQLRHPIMQAPMAGGGDTPALVAAVSAAGGLGCIGAAYLNPTQIIAAAAAVRERTDRPFGINLFAPLPATAAGELEQARRAVAPFYAELGLPLPSDLPLPAYTFADQLAAVLETDAALFSVTFGLPPADAVAALKRREVVVAGTVTTVAEARAMAAAGADALIAQGSEAGGHRGSFLGGFEQSLVGSMALVPQMVDAVSLPVIASGGIMDGRGIVAAQALGACAVQMGTAFLTCDEAGFADAYKQRVLAAQDDETRLTRAFSGRPARGLVNRFMRAVDAVQAADAILPFPWQNALTRPLRTAATQQGRADMLSLWAGQAASLARRQTAAELMARLVAEYAAVRASMAADA